MSNPCMANISGSVAERLHVNAAPAPNRQSYASPAPALTAVLRLILYGANFNNLKNLDAAPAPAQAGEMIWLLAAPVPQH
jgi:hypothetical protein